MTGKTPTRRSPPPLNRTSWRPKRWPQAATSASSAATTTKSEPSAAAKSARRARLSSKLFIAIDSIVSQAHRIDDGKLDRRLPHPGTDDEVGHLVDTLNAMLGRIEQAFDTQRRFTADTSHELRSPLSRLRTEIEITLRRERSIGQYVSTLRS